MNKRLIELLFETLIFFLTIDKFLLEKMYIISYNCRIIHQSLNYDIQTASILVCIRIKNCIELFLNR